MGKIEKHLTGIKTGGFKYFAKVVRESWPYKLFTTGEVELLAKDSYDINPKVSDEFKARLASLDDLDTIGGFGDVFDRQRCEYQLKRGDACVVIFKNDRLVMSGWGAVGRLYCRANAAIVETGDDGYYVYGGYTIAEERRKGLASLAEKVLAEFYAKQKRHKMLVLIDPKNTPSITMHKNHDFGIIGHARFFWFFGMLISVYKYWPLATGKIRVFTKHPPDGYDWV